MTKYVEREILNHRVLMHPHIVQFKEVRPHCQLPAISLMSETSHLCCLKPGQMQPTQSQPAGATSELLLTRPWPAGVPHTSVPRDRDGVRGGGRHVRVRRAEGGPQGERGAVVLPAAHRGRGLPPPHGAPLYLQICRRARQHTNQEAPSTAFSGAAQHQHSLHGSALCSALAGRPWAGSTGSTGGFLFAGLVPGSTASSCTHSLQSACPVLTPVVR